MRTKQHKKKAGPVGPKLPDQKCRFDKSPTRNKYGIFIETDKVVGMEANQHKRTALLGEIVKIEGQLCEGRLLIKFPKDVETLESTTFWCKQRSIVRVDERLWQFLYAVKSPKKRVKLAKNKKKCDKLNKITEDMTVRLQDDDGGHLGQIKYLGPMIGEVAGGHYIGIKLQQKKQDNECDGLYFGSQYFHCSPGYGIFTTIDRIVLEDTDEEPPKDIDNLTDSEELENWYKENSLSNRNKRVKTLSHDSPVLRGNEPSTPNCYDRIRIPEEVNGVKNGCSSNQEAIPKINEGSDKAPSTSAQHHHNNDVNDDQPKYYPPMPGTTKDLELGSLVEVSNGVTTDLLYGVVKWMGAAKETNCVLVGVELELDYENLSLPLTDGTYERQSFFKSTEKRALFVPLDRCRQDSSFQHRPFVDVKPKCCTPMPGTTEDLTLGSLVGVSNDVTDESMDEVVEWIEVENATNFAPVGIELEEEPKGLPLTLADGTHNGEGFFKSSGNKALSVPMDQYHQDSRFQDGLPTPMHQASEPNSQSMDCPKIEAPRCMSTDEDVEAFSYQAYGIKGQENSCYLDVTLFSMFTYTAVFDSLLFRPKGPRDIPEYNEVQRVLREEIVNPLRKNLFVPADHVMNLRRLLDRLSTVSGLTSEQKDPEEFIDALLGQVLKAEPCLKLNSGQEAFCYQLFVERGPDLTLPTVQQLLAQSFLASNIKLKEVPSCLIIQMPRFGNDYKVYPRILPSQLLDVTDVIDSSPRQCACGEPARFKCQECFDECSNADLKSTAFCPKCLETAHRHEGREHHRPIELEVMLKDHCRGPTVFMELFAVLCIRTSHYVAFVKCGVGHEAPWCYFNSMYFWKRKEKYRMAPKIEPCPDISQWLSDERICRKLHEDFPEDEDLPDHARSLLCDAYVCMYQRSDVNTNR